jgi:hypothetical protein
MIAGCDPGLGHTGFALVALDRELVTAGVSVTVKGPKSARGDVQRRCEEHGRALSPIIRRAAVLVVEWPTGAGFAKRGTACPACGQSRGNSSAASTTMAVAGIAKGIAWGVGIPVWSPAPVTWRSVLGYKRGRDDKDGDLDERIHGAMMALYGEQIAKLKIPRRYLPHVLEAIAMARARLEWSAND